MTRTFYSCYNGGVGGGYIIKKKIKQQENTIYVSICCLGKDIELVNTIKSIYDKSKNKENIYVGITFIGDNYFYKETVKHIKKYKNIKTSYYSNEECLGIGPARLYASYMYDEEDYFLQIDAHTYMFENWDKTLIDKYKSIKTTLNSDKIVLSGSLPSYEYIDNKIKFDNMLKYSFYPKQEFFFNSIVLFSSIDPTIVFNEFYKNNQYFKPLLKTVAAFMFGSKELATNLGLNNTVIFWEEEILQTINLISDGFILVHPGPDSVMAHYNINYIKHECTGGLVDGRHMYKENGRVDVTEVYPNALQYSLKNYYSFILDPKNKEKVQRYEKYANINMITGSNEDYYYPKEYVNKL